MKVLLVGYNNGVLSALDQNPLDNGGERYEVWVLEEPDLWEAKNLEKKARKHSCFRGVYLAEYQQSEAFLSELEQLPHVDAVAPGLEYAVPAAARLAEIMAKDGCGVEAAEIIRDKLKFRDVTSAKGLASPKYQQVSSAEDVATFLAQGPAVLKPAQRQASLGVRILDAEADCTKAWEELIAADEGVQIANRPMKWTYLIESKLVGTEFSTEVLVNKGEILFINVTQKTTRDGAFPVEIAHSLPCREREDEWKDCIRLLIDAVGFQSGMIHAEWMLSADGPVPIECAGRPPGDHITELIDIAWGIPFIGAWIHILAGAMPKLPPEPRQAAAIQFLESEAGVVAGLPDLRTIEASPDVVSVEITAKVGKRIGEVRSSWDRAGSVIAKGSDPETALLNAKQAADQIEIKMED